MPQDKDNIFNVVYTDIENDIYHNKENIIYDDLSHLSPNRMPI